jgi:hypothetical protein
MQAILYWNISFDASYPEPLRGSRPILRADAGVSFKLTTTIYFHIFFY